MSLHSTEDILNWVLNLNKNIYVSINKVGLGESGFWFYNDDTGCIENQNKSFFQITGLRKKLNGNVVLEQPVILQKEIGYLGIICKKIKGEMHYLMQAKIEPGNINKIQISPTIQATKSNFTQKHGGAKPAYLDYFINADKYKIIVDQIQSEQSSRFLGKRNRNIILEVTDEVEVLPNFRWMTLSQLKQLMRYDNLVNMDTRTVLSCIPVDWMPEAGDMKDISLYRSAIEGNKHNNLSDIYNYINNFKMFDDSQTEIVPLKSLNTWHMSGGEFVCDTGYSFKVIFCDIEIEGREVRRWTQPLLEASGPAIFALFTRVRKGIKEFLVRATGEVGCFDKIELGPSVQREYFNEKPNSLVDDYFDATLQSRRGIVFDTMLSEEGGRFYCEQNRNLIIEVDNELDTLPKGYFWVDYKTLNSLVQVNNCLNIQLRNLLSVMEW